MTREVYTDQEFIEYSHKWVLVRLFADTDSQGARLARRYGVRGFPTLLVLDDRGRELNRLPGFRGAERLKADLESILDAAGPEEEIETPAPTRTPPKSQPPPAAAPTTPAAPVAELPQPPAAPSQPVKGPARQGEPDSAIKPSAADPIARLERNLAAAKDEAEIKWLQVMLGIAHFQAQHWKEARQYMTLVLKKDPNNTSAQEIMKALEIK